MRDAFEAVAQTVRKVVRRVHLRVRCAYMPLIILEDAVRCNVPHLRVVALNVLLHAQGSRLRCVLSVSHVSKLGQIGVATLRGVRAAIARTFFAVFSTARELNLGLGAVAHVCLA